MKGKSLLVLVAGIVAGACGCGGGSASSRTINLPLAITTISPTSAPAGGAAFVLGVRGTSFVPGSVINFGNMPITAAAYSCIEWDYIPQPFCGAAQLSATIPAAAITTPGAVPVTVTNPAGGGTSNAVNIAITSGPYPEANITSIGPIGAVAGSPGFTLTLEVSNFLAGSVVRWNGSDRPTTATPNFAVSCCPLVEAQIPASDIVAPGTAAITIFNPAPGAGSSNAVTFAITLHGVSPSSVAVHPAGTFAYVTNSGSDNVSTYAINTDGTLTFKATIAAGRNPVSIAVHRSGKFAYAANSGDCCVPGSVSMYGINADGLLTSIGTISLTYGAASVTVHPSGKFAYVPIITPLTISTYSIDATTGALTFTGTIPSGTFPASVAVDPSGKFAYVANTGDSVDVPPSISMYTIDSMTGALMPNGEITNDGSTTVVVDPSGRFAYVASGGATAQVSTNLVSMYSIDATTGKLTSIGTVDAAGGGGVGSLAVHPSGKFVYAASGSNLSPGLVSVYTLNATTGVLASIGTAPTEQSPTSIAIDPSGKFAYVANYNSHSISMYTIDAVTGTLTLIGTIIT